MDKYDYLYKYAQGELIFFFIFGILISLLLIKIPEKFSNYINLIGSIIFFFWCLIIINNTAITLHEATPYLICMSLYLLIYHINKTFSITLKNKTLNENDKKKKNYITIGIIIVAIIILTLIS